jgi:hypothetical protein
MSPKAHQKLAWLGKTAQWGDVSIWFPSWPIATASREALMADEPCGFLEGHLTIVSPKPVEVAEPTAAQAVKSPVRLVEILFTGARFTNIQNDSAARKDVAAQIAERLLPKGR